MLALQVHDARAAAQRVVRLEQQVSEHVRELAGAESRERALDALVALGAPAQPFLLAELRTRIAGAELAHAEIDGLLRVLAALGPDAAGAEDVLQEVIDDQRLRPHAETAWWALGRVAGRMAPPAVSVDATAQRFEALRFTTAQIVLARKDVGLPDAGTVRSMLESGSWLERCVAALHVPRLRGAAPDLEAKLLQLFRTEFDRRRQWRVHENWALQEVADAVAALPAHADEQVLVHVARLRHLDPRVRRLAAIALRSFGPFAAPFVDDLALALDDGVADVVRETLLTLGGVGPVAAAVVPSLHALTEHPRSDVAAAARTTLARLRVQLGAGAGEAGRAVELLLRAPAAERAHLVESLPRTTAAAETLAVAFASLSRADPELRQDVLLGMRVLGPAAADQASRLLQLLPVATPQDRDGLLAVFGAMGAAAARVADLRARLESAALACDPAPLEALSEALAAILVAPEQDTGRLVRFLVDANPVLRLRAAERLAQLPELPAEALAALEQAVSLAHPTDVVLPRARGQAMWHALAGDEVGLAAARPLLANARATPAQVRRAAAQLLEGDDADRAAALQRLPVGGFAGELPAVVACLRSSDDALALAAIAALARGGATAAAALPELRVLAGGEGDVATAAAAAVRALTAR